MAEGNGELIEGADVQALAAQLQLARHELAVMESALLSRTSFGAKHGLMFDGARDTYSVLGYPQRLTFQDYLSKYLRQDIAATVIDRPVKATWAGGVVLQDNADPQVETPFEQAWVELERQHHIAQTFRRLDVLASIGEYAVMLIGVKGQPEIGRPMTRTSTDRLIYLTPYSQPAAQISALIKDRQNPRFGYPEIYDLQIRVTTGLVDLSESVKAHWSRCVHVAQGGLENDVIGTPAMEKVFNLLHDMAKVVGGASETFWLQASGILHANTQAGSRPLSDKQVKAMAEQVEEIQHRLRSYIATSGIDLKSLTAPPADPSGAFKVIISLLSAATHIPQRFLTGTERGELASKQDDNNFADAVETRRKEFAEPAIVRQTVDRFIEFGILPAPTNKQYDVIWGDNTDADEKERAETAGLFAVAAANFSNARAIVDPSEARVWMGLPPDHPNPEEQEKPEIVPPGGQEPGGEDDPQDESGDDPDDDPAPEDEPE